MSLLKRIKQWRIKRLERKYADLKKKVIETMPRDAPGYYSYECHFWRLSKWSQKMVKLKSK